MKRRHLTGPDGHPPERTFMAGVKEQFGSTRRDFIRSVAGAVGAIAVDAPDLKAQAMPTSSSQKKPNFVFFLGEGVRWDEFSFAGNKIIHTPNIDRLAHEGMVFRNAFVVNALCLPSRASILTGLYSHTTGAVDNRDRPIPPAAPVISDLLRAAGYDVAFIGKSHVKGSLRDRYWDYYFGFDGQAEYYSPTITEGVRGVFGQPKKYDGNYVEDLLLEKALNYLNQPHDRPFCLFLWFYAPHAPFYRPRRLLDLYNGVPIPKPATFDDDLKGYLGKPRAFVEARNKIGTTEMEDDARSLEELVKDHYAGVVSNDEAVGKVVQVLEDKHALDDTAILFSSDHGFFLGEWRIFDKRFMHEPSIRVPLIIRYPRMIRPGTSIGQMALNLDLAPSILELAGIPIPIAMQGKSLVPFLNGETPVDWRKDWLYEYYEFPEDEHVPPHRGVRSDRYKLIHYYTMVPQEYELYDLQVDPGERNNLWAESAYNRLSEQLLTRIDELRKQTGDHLPDTIT
jgi:arylsulfatase A-like enzyme